MSEIKDKNGNVLDEWPTCLYCGSPLGYWEGDRYFCQVLGCRMHYLPQELFFEAEMCGVTYIAKLEDKDKIIEAGGKVVRIGVGGE